MTSIKLGSGLGENLIINPSMDIAQRGTSFANTADFLRYTLDRWLFAKGIGPNIDVSQVADVPTWSKNTYSLKLTNQAVSLAGTNGFITIMQKIEGYNLRKIRGKNSVIQFSVKASKSGIYTLLLSNADTSVRMAKSFSINASNTWEQKVIRLPVINESLGTFNFDNSTGLEVEFALASGSNYIAVDENWNSTTSGVVGSPTHNVDFGDTIGNTFQITDIALHEGIEPIAFDKLMRDYGTELQLCQRYYEILDIQYTNYQVTGPTWWIDYPYKVEKRAQPIATTNTLRGGESSPNTSSFGVYGTNTIGLTLASVMTSTANIRYDRVVNIDAEL